MGCDEGTYTAARRAAMGSVTTDVPDGAEITVNASPPEPKPCSDAEGSIIHGPHPWSFEEPDGMIGYTAHCPGWWPGCDAFPMVAPEYVPVDTSFDARVAWPEMHFTEDQLNGRELGQFIAGVVWGESCSGDRRAWRIAIPTEKLAGVTAALVDRGFAVAKEWSHPNPHVTQLAVWSGL